MVEQYTQEKGHTPTNISTIPQNGEELVALLKTYKIDSKKNETIVLGNNNANNLTVPYFAASNNEEKKKGFFEKIRSVFSKK